MMEFKPATEMLKITGAYRLEECMKNIEDSMIRRAQIGHSYLILDVVDMKDSFNINPDDMSFIFNELLRSGYDIEDETETWVIRWA